MVPAGKTEMYPVKALEDLGAGFILRPGAKDFISEGKRERALEAGCSLAVFLYERPLDKKMFVKKETVVEKSL
ncbi:hypothetical protein EBO34_03950 [Alteribacter keqinensis]|uniref:Uncharacterized protein n=1 Tax=Alteribacter keqinensis TaxID=2483800 RepID=A0A3M7TXG1_9BACI|nr:hypothetical protein EBO34_03950 [Alteribacter keqinensis]